jgi:hypothetical protein
MVTPRQPPPGPDPAMAEAPPRGRCWPRWLGTVRLGRHRRAPWPHLLAALASDLSGWDARHPFIVASPGKKMGPAGQAHSPAEAAGDAATQCRRT